LGRCTHGDLGSTRPEPMTFEWDGGAPGNRLPAIAQCFVAVSFGEPVVFRSGVLAQSIPVSALRITAQMDVHSGRKKRGVEMLG
jgi:hypothetical protein